MIEEALKLLDGTAIVENNLPAIIEVFIEYYGEESREHVIERFNNLKFFCFNKPTEKEAIIKSTLNSLQTSYYQKFFKKYNIEYTIENIKLYFPQSLSSPSSCLLTKYSEFRRHHQIPVEERRKKQLNLFLPEISQSFSQELTIEKLLSMRETKELDIILNKIPIFFSEYIKNCLKEPYVDSDEERIISSIIESLRAVDPSITKENFKTLYEEGTHPTIVKLNSMLEDYQLMRQNYQREIAPLKSYMEYCDKCEKILSTSAKKAFINFILDNKQNIPEYELAIFKSQIDSRQPLDFDNLPTIYNYFNISFSYKPMINAFSSESYQILKDYPDSWLASSIKEDRIRFFNSYGINLGRIYDYYANDTSCKKLWPEKTFVDKLIVSRQKAEEKYKIDYYRSLPDYMKIKNEIERLGYICKHNDFNPNLYENIFMCVCPDSRNINGNLVISPIAFFRLTHTKIESIDGYIMHELNHVYEINLLSDEENRTIYSCGWDIIIQNKNQTIEDTLIENKTKRNYELFNEIINELISQDISRLLHRRGIYLFSNKENARITNKSSYEPSLFLIEEFYQLYREDIIASRRTFDMDILFAKIGEDNFNELNELFHIFHEKLSKNNINEILKYIEEQKETPETILYKNLIERKNAIISKMKEQTASYNETHSMAKK